MEYGKQFHCTFDIFKDPKKYDFLTLYQCGELSCEKGFVVHRHPQHYYEISCFISGEGYNYRNDQRFPVKEGQIFINLPGEYHQIESSKQAPLRYLYMAWDFPEEMAESLLPLREFFQKPLENPVLADKLDVAVCLSKLVNEFYNGWNYSEEMVNTYLFQILCLIYRTAQMSGLSAGDFRKNQGVGGTVYRAIQYIDNNLYDIVNVGTICQALNYSPSYLSRTFHAKTGMTLQAYLNQKRVEAAVRLMQQQALSLGEIAEKLHFESVQSFSRIFKRISGISPSRYEEEVDNPLGL